MEHQNPPFPLPARRQRARFSWGGAVLFVIVITGLVFLVVFWNTGREEKRMRANMNDWANVLIWTLEGNARSIGHTWNDSLQTLMEEMAKHPRITYIAIASADGRILVHTDPSRTGTMLYGPEKTAPLSISEDSQVRLISYNGHKVLEVYKLFSPLPGGTIFVGIDALHFEEKLQEHTRHTGAIATLVALIVFIGVALYFYMRNYRLSSRMLKDTQALATEVINSHPAALVVTDEHGIIALSNRHGQALLGLSGKGKLPRSVHDVSFLDWRSLMDELDAGTDILERSVDLFISKTSPLPMSISAAKIAGSEDGFAGYLFILRDLAEIRKLEKQVKQHERLSALGNMAAGVAHEIRNPLSSIKGYATYLTEKVKDDKMAYATGHILIQETERLNRVVSDLLSVAKPLELRRQPARIETVLEQALRIITPDAEAKGLSVRLHLPQEDAFSGQHILLDADRLMQALLNLLVNAVQATDSGGNIQVVLENIAQDGGSHFLAVSVTDTGCGMSAQTVAKLFTPYFTTKASGTGLGLTLAQQIVEQHGGEMKVFSRPGEGATFTILLPWANEERNDK